MMKNNNTDGAWFVTRNNKMMMGLMLVTRKTSIGIMTKKIAGMKKMLIVMSAMVIAGGIMLMIQRHALIQMELITTQETIVPQMEILLLMQTQLQIATPHLMALEDSNLVFSLEMIDMIWMIILSMKKDLIDMTEMIK